MGRFKTIEEVFSHVCEEFRPAKALNEQALIQLDFSSSNDGLYWVKIDNGTCMSGSGTAPGVPDVTLSTRSEDWLKVVNDEINPMLAYLQGKLKLQGKKALALKLQYWFED
jgi:putative sterol carrier protein